MVCQTKPRIKIGFPWQIICSFYITSHLLPLFLFVCHTQLACEPFHSALHISRACLDGDLTWIMPWTAYTVLITLIIIDLTGLWINLWRNTFASHYLPWWSSACVCRGWRAWEGPMQTPRGPLGSGEGHRSSLGEMGHQDLFSVGLCQDALDATPWKVQVQLMGNLWGICPWRDPSRLNRLFSPFSEASSPEFLELQLEVLQQMF